MTANSEFARLREQLSRGNHPATMLALSKLLEQWPADKERAIAVAYAREHIQSWPNARIPLCLQEWTTIPYSPIPKGALFIEHSDDPLLRLLAHQRQLKLLAPDGTEYWNHDAFGEIFHTQHIDGRLHTVDENGHHRLWTVDTLAPPTERLHTTIRDATFARLDPTASNIVVAQSSLYGAEAAVWDLQTGARRFVCSFDMGYIEDQLVNDVAFSPDGRVVAVLSRLQTELTTQGYFWQWQYQDIVGLWSMEDGTFIGQYIIDYENELDAPDDDPATIELKSKCRFSADGRWLVMCWREDFVALDPSKFLPNNFYQLQEKGFSYCHEQFDISPDGTKLAVATFDECCIWELGDWLANDEKSYPHPPRKERQFEGNITGLQWTQSGDGVWIRTEIDDEQDALQLWQYRGA